MLIVQYRSKTLRYDKLCISIVSYDKDLWIFLHFQEKDLGIFGFLCIFAPKVKYVTVIKICPLEVKSSSYKRHVSLDLFSEKYSDRIDRKYLIYTKDLSKDKDVIFLPVYLVPFL